MNAFFKVSSSLEKKTCLIMKILMLRQVQVGIKCYFFFAAFFAGFFAAFFGAAFLVIFFFGAAFFCRFLSSSHFYLLFLMIKQRNFDHPTSISLVSIFTEVQGKEARNMESELWSRSFNETAFFLNC